MNDLIVEIVSKRNFHDIDESEEIKKVLEEHKKLLSRIEKLKNTPEEDNPKNHSNIDSPTDFHIDTDKITDTYGKETKKGRDI